MSAGLLVFYWEFHGQEKGFGVWALGKWIYMADGFVFNMLARAFRAHFIFIAIYYFGCSLMFEAISRPW